MDQSEDPRFNFVYKKRKCDELMKSDLKLFSVQLQNLPKILLSY